LAIAHSVLNSIDNLVDFFLHAVKVLIFGQEGDLVCLERFAQRTLQKLNQPSTRALLFRQIGQENGVVGQRTRPLIVVVAGLGDEVADVEEHAKLYDEGEDADDYLSIINSLLYAGEVDHEAGAANYSVVAVNIVFFYCPVEFQCVVAAYRHQKQDDAVFDEHVEEGEPKSQELQLL
jgi:hypothetical protein